MLRIMAYFGLLVLCMTTFNVVHCEPRVPCYFIFGDSLSDNGNNNDLVTRAKANYPPYGIDFPGGIPTGRFSNGLNFVDRITELLGFDDYIPPYSKAKWSEILKGVNYASGAAGIRSETGNHLEILVHNKYTGEHVTHTVSGGYMGWHVGAVAPQELKKADVFSRSAIVDKPCCDVRNDFQCQKSKTPCAERGTYIFWDGYHTTEMANIATAESSFNAIDHASVHPMDINTLLSNDAASINQKIATSDFSATK